MANLGAIVTLPMGAPSIEIAKRRPVVVMSYDALNRLSDGKPFYVVVVPGTTGKGAFRDQRFSIRVLPSDSGLREEGVYLAHQMRSIDSRRLDPHPIGKLTDAAMSRLVEAVTRVLAIHAP